MNSSVWTSNSSRLPGDPRTMHGVVVALVVILATRVLWAGEEFSVASLGLPASVQVTAVHAPSVGTPFDRLQVRESATRLSAVQEFAEGGLGWVAGDLTFADPVQTLIYDIRKRRGARSGRLGATGTTRLDGLATPYGWIRLFAFTAAQGGKVKVEAGEGGTTLFRVTPQGQQQSSFTCVVDEAHRELLEVRVGKGDFLTRYRYGDWRALGADFHLPRRIEFEYPSGGPAGRVTKVYLIERAEAFPDEVIDPPSLPTEAIIDDQLIGRTVRGDGTAIETANPASATNSGSLPLVNRNTVLVVIGVGLVIAAGVLAKKKRRA